MLIKIIIWLLRSKRLSKQERIDLSTEVMRGLNIVPMHDIISTDAKYQFLVNGNPIDMETAIRLKESASQVLNSFARSLIHQQIQRLAFVNGFHKASDIDQILFYKAALWFSEQEDILLKSIAQDPTL